ARPAPAATLRFPIPGVPPGTYMVRVRVDGADSALEVQTNEALPNFNQYIGPTVGVPS
ncbi:MAG TPA: DUF4255 domain-containing protein, partial [Solibacterales bacterium]|nr:DUF4255 domain-containing protein [Bryobacterales bacterium]